MKNILFAFVLLIGMFVPRAFSQNQFVYTYNKGVNSVSGFSVAPNGALTQLQGSPFSIGSGENIGGYLSASPITSLQTGNFLYVANAAAGSISAFSINPSTGVLTLIPGSPFPASLTTQCSFSASSDGNFLFQGFLENNNFNPGGQSKISVFRIASTGALTEISGSPFIIPGGLFHIQVSPDNKFLAVAQWTNLTIAMLNIDTDGRLTPVAGSPFSITGFGNVVRVRFHGSTNRLYALRGDNYLESFGIGSDGRLTFLTSTPVTSPGGNVSDLLLTPNNQFLFVSNLDGRNFNSFKVAQDGNLSIVTGSPFANLGGKQPSGLAANQAGTLLYAYNLDKTISVFSLALNGVLNAVANSPFSTGQLGEPAFIAAYPTGSINIKIVSIAISGKKLFVTGENFDNGAVIFINGEDVGTINNDENPTTRLIAKKGGKRIKVGKDTLIQVRNSTGALSQEFHFSRVD